MVVVLGDVVVLGHDVDFAGGKSPCVDIVHAHVYTVESHEVAFVVAEEVFLHDFVLHAHIEPVVAGRH